MNRVFYHSVFQLQFYYVMRPCDATWSPVPGPGVHHIAGNRDGAKQLNAAVHKHRPRASNRYHHHHPLCYHLDLDLHFYLHCRRDVSPGKRSACSSSRLPRPNLPSTTLPAGPPGEGGEDIPLVPLPSSPSPSRAHSLEPAPIFAPPASTSHTNQTDTAQASPLAKFSDCLRFNSLPEWRSSYLDYSSLKALVHSLASGTYIPSPLSGRSDGYSAPHGRERESDRHHDHAADVDIESESAALLSDPEESDPADTLSPDRVLVSALDKQLKKIRTFYCEQERLGSQKVQWLVQEVEHAERDGISFGPWKTGSNDHAHESAASLVHLPNTLVDVDAHDGSVTSLIPNDVSANDVSAVHEASGTRHGEPSGRGEPLNSADTPGRTWSPSTSAPVRPCRTGSSDFLDKSKMHGDPCGGPLWSTEDGHAIDVAIRLTRSLAQQFVTLSELQQYVHLNLLGLRKILKKYDQALARSLKETYLTQVISKQRPFTTSARTALFDQLRTVVGLYARIRTRDQPDIALVELQAHLREQVVWRRYHPRPEDTDRADLSGEATDADVRPDADADDTRAWGGSSSPSAHEPHRPAAASSWPTSSTVQLVGALVIFVALLKLPFLRIFDRVEEQNCLAMLVLCTILWATEVIPLFVTSFLVPFFVVTLRVARSDDGKDRRLGADETAKWIFLQMFAPNMCLLIGGFTLAAALSKYGIDKVLAVRVLRLAGTRPSTVLLAHMGVATFVSMWVSNVAAPVLMYGLIQPILETLPEGSPYARALIIGIALASNIGGQTSPIASPQNLIALQYMKDPLGWLQWFAITVPVSGLSVVVIWLLMLRVYGTGKGVTIQNVAPSSSGPFSQTQWLITGVSVATILLWCMERNFEYILGDMGVVALIPLVVFFGSGVLTKDDFNNFLWTVVFLAMGGIALGKAVTASGLLGSLDMCTFARFPTSSTKKKKGGEGRAKGGRQDGIG